MGAALPRLRTRTWILLAIVLAVGVAVGVVAGTTAAWGSTLRGEDRLLPGTTIATVAVGEVTADEAVVAVEDHLAGQLDRTVTVTYDDRVWETTARELGATTDVDALVAEALEHTSTAGFTDLVRARWLGDGLGADLDVAVDVPDDAVADLVAAAADDVDRDARDAEVAWEDDAFEVTADRTGLATDRDAAVLALTDALGGGTDTVELPVAVTEASVTTAAAEGIATEVGAVVDAALDHAVTVTLEDATATVTPRELGAVPDVAPLLEDAFAEVTATPVSATDEDDDPAARVDLDIPGDRLTAVIDELAAGKERAVQHPEVSFVGDEVQVSDGVDGAALDRESSRASLREALAGGSDQVELSLQTIAARQPDEAAGRVLVVEQGARTVSLYVDGVRARQWPVAVGTGGSPTPTGTFTIGAKRHEPTWVNPAPDRWGADMPAQVGPGPDNPLGVRALNWNRPGGGDTLIRFHGTPNEASIGTAASNGCVRMFNSDVVELYDLVQTGDTIISRA
jgi:vancomycin resistance protein YoaR